MKPSNSLFPYHWIMPHFLSVGLALYLFLKPEPITETFLISVIVCITFSFFGCLGLDAWKIYLNIKHGMEWTEEITTLRNTISSKDLKITNIIEELDTAKIDLAAAQNKVPTEAKKMFDLAEKLRTKITIETKSGERTSKTTDKVPTEVREHIIQNFSKP